MIAFDSNVLIYALSQNPYMQQEAIELFRKIANVGGVCSALIITESLYGNLRKFDQLTPLLSPLITVVPISKAIAEHAGNLKIDYGLGSADAIHIATALSVGAKEFVTNDRQLLKKQIPRIEIRGL